TNRRILREMLAAEGIAVDEAVDAPRGLAALRGAAAAGAPYDLAILDVQMPHMDGFQLAAAVRADAGLAHTQLLMLTSTGQRGDGERCRALGIRAYLTKPLARADLLEALGAVLAEPPAAGSGDVITRHSIAESRVGLRILLVEDNAVNQEVAVAMLVKRGHAVHVADNGQEAVRAVTQRGYDVVLMDIQMPTMDGFQATAAIRALPHGHALPIIGLTAHAVSGERERCLARGMTDYLAKPFKAAELFAVVEERAASPSAIATASPPPPPAPAPPIDLDGFRSTMRDAGAEGAVYAILDTFERQGPERLAAVAAAVRGGDAGAIARAAHVFRGAAATIGARELATLLERVETAARAGNVQEARDALERTHIAARAALDYLRRERQRAHAAEEGER
ncbi:MAG: response regulator, partial [Gemmatimonadales bacterium]